MQGSAVFGMGKADEESRFRATTEVKAYKKSLRETVGRNISASLNRISYPPLDVSFIMSTPGSKCLTRGNGKPERCWLTRQGRLSTAARSKRLLSERNVVPHFVALFGFINVRCSDSRSP